MRNEPSVLCFITTSDRARVRSGASAWGFVEASVYSLNSCIASSSHWNWQSEPSDVCTTFGACSSNNPFQIIAATSEERWHQKCQRCRNRPCCQCIKQCTPLICVQPKTRESNLINLPTMHSRHVRFLNNPFEFKIKNQNAVQPAHARLYPATQSSSRVSVSETCECWIPIELASRQRTCVVAFHSVWLTQRVINRNASFGWKIALLS